MSIEKNFSMPVRRGRAPRLFLVLDTETATLPFVNEWKLSAMDKKKIAIARPLVYDLGWQIIDAKGEVYSRHSFLIQETFFVPSVFNTAYYAEKRPRYLQKLEAGEITVKTWREATKVLEEDLMHVFAVAAYNAMFDFKKSLTYTDTYINALYSPYYNDWERGQKELCKAILAKKENPNKKPFDGENFIFRNKHYPMVDIWGEVCREMIDTDKYRKTCLVNDWLTDSGLYFKTSAEKTFAYLMNDKDFSEAHTAMEDTIIESALLVKFFRNHKVKIGLTYFPFQQVGTTYDFLVKNGIDYLTYKEEREQEHKKVYRKAPLSFESYNNAIGRMLARTAALESVSSFAVNLSEKAMRLGKLVNEIFPDEDCNIELAKSILMYNFFDKRAKSKKEGTEEKAAAEYFADLFFDMVQDIKEKMREG